MKEVKQILTQIEGRNFNPIYFLMGEEPFYIDEISKAISNSVLTEEEKGFNQTVVYGRDVSIDEIIGHSKRYPMMSEFQVVIVKEAQDLSRQIEQLVSYVDNPQLSTVLVINYKYKKIDKRKALYKALKKQNAVILETKKLYDNQVADWINDHVKTKGYSISMKASYLLVEFLGADQSKINNELDKLIGLTKVNETITPELIESYIGISKDYNNFELKKAIGVKDVQKVFKIAKYFSDNPKDNPFVVTVSMLYNFFSQLMIYHGLNNKSKQNIATTLGINPYFVSEYIDAARYYPMKKVSQVITSLRTYDMKGKGVDAHNLSQSDLLNEMLVEILS